MPKYIDADAYWRKMQSVFEQDLEIEEGYWEEILDDMPCEDVEPVRHGKWKNTRNIYSCSLCGCAAQLIHTPYCPNCGAKMDLEE